MVEIARCHICLNQKKLLQVSASGNSLFAARFAMRPARSRPLMPGRTPNRTRWLATTAARQSNEIAQGIIGFSGHSRAPSLNVRMVLYSRAGRLFVAGLLGEIQISDATAPSQLRRWYCSVCREFMCQTTPREQRRRASLAVGQQYRNLLSLVDRGLLDPQIFASGRRLQRLMRQKNEVRRIVRPAARGGANDR